MPGNETVYKSPRAYLPVMWARNNIAQGASVVADAAGLPTGLNQIPMAKAGSITAIGLLLSEPVISGSITVTLLRNGASTGQALSIGPGEGVTKVGDLAPGAALYAVGETVGVRVSASAGLAPNAQIDLAIYLENQND